MHHLHAGMDASIRSGRTGDGDRMPACTGERLLQNLLDSQTIDLALPAGVSGSVIFNGEAIGDNVIHFFHMNQHFYEDTEIYGGVYVKDNVYIEAYSVNGSKRDKEKITKFLKELGYPKP